MKIAIVGVTGSIGGVIFEQALQRSDITHIVAVTRRPLSSPHTSDERVQNVVIPDFGALDTVTDATWSLIRDADALIWAMGTYKYEKDANFDYPLAFQEHLGRQIVTSGLRRGDSSKFRFILLGGALTETDQSRWLCFLGDQRRMKGLLQTKTLEFADAHGEFWDAHIIRPGAVLIGSETVVNKTAAYLLGGGLAIRGQELGAFTAHLAVRGSDHNIIENLEMVETGRRLLAES